MLSFFSRRSRRESKPVFDIEKAVGHYLLKLPRCASAIVAVSPRYGEQHYRCEVVLDVAMIVDWAASHAKDVWCSDGEEQAARRALPFWLRAFDESDMTPSDIPRAFSAVLRPYILDFIKEDIAAVTCLECCSIVDDIKMARLNERGAHTWSWWTDEWRCPHGHLLYRQDHQLHVVLGHAGSRTT